MLDMLVIFLVVISPALAGEVYVYILKHTELTRKEIIFLSISMFVGSYIFILYLSFLALDSTPLERIISVSVIYFSIFMLGFHSFHENFKRAFFNKRKNENINKDCSDFVLYYSSPKKVFIVSMIYLFVYYGLYFFISMLVFSILLLGENAKPTLAVLCYIIALFGAGYLLCISFLRLLVKCLNCESYVFYMDRELSAFNKIAKRAVKDRILDCEYCYATYALDTKLDLDKLRREKKERILRDNERADKK